MLQNTLWKDIHFHPKSTTVACCNYGFWASMFIIIVSKISWLLRLRVQIPVVTSVIGVHYYYYVFFQTINLPRLPKHVVTQYLLQTCRQNTMIRQTSQPTHFCKLLWRGSANNDASNSSSRRFRFRHSCSIGTESWRLVRSKPILRRALRRRSAS